MTSETIYLQLEARDPVIARDGRPFGIRQGRRMRSLDWLYPSTVAGSVRTTVGKLRPGIFSHATVAALKQLAFGGPFPVSSGQLYFPAPGDCLKNAIDGCIHTIRPQTYAASEQTDLPGSLLPVMLPETVHSFKFGAIPAWWSSDRMTAWLMQRDEIPEFFFNPPGQFLQAPERDERTHVQIDPDSYTAAEGMLFTTVGLVLDQLRQNNAVGCSPLPPVATSLSVRIDPRGHFPKEWSKLALLHPVGGERRLVKIHRVASADATGQEPVASAGGWQCPEGIRRSLDGAERVRMVLASPAHFAHGWRPEWLNTLDDSGWCGCLPGTDVGLRLVGVANQRWRAVSGWSVETGGPKPIRRLVPAGAVYFFESLNPDKSANLTQRWLASVSDDPILRTEGFGLALWGIW